MQSFIKPPSGQKFFKCLHCDAEFVGTLFTFKCPECSSFKIIENKGLQF